MPAVPEQSVEPGTPEIPKKRLPVTSGPSMDVQMFSNASNFSINDTEINNAGRDITINNYHYHIETGTAPDNRTFFSGHIPGAAMFHFAAETIKKLVSVGFSAPSEIDLKETIAEDVHKYPRLEGTNVKVLESKTTMCLPGSLLQTLASIRYSFF